MRDWRRQGLGDVIQYARSRRWWSKAGPRGGVACRPRLVGLCGASAASTRWCRTTSPRHRPTGTVRCWTCRPSGSRTSIRFRGRARTCPRVCGRRPCCSRRASSGSVSSGRAAPRRSRTAAVPAAWRTSRRSSSCRARSSSAFRVGPPARELRAGWRGRVHDPGDALMEVDLVITVDTMLAHLAGALGRPVWTLLAFAPDMRWMLDRADTPWYPTMRLYRQPAPNDWAGRVAPSAPRTGGPCRAAARSQAACTTRAATAVTGSPSLVD